MSLRAKITLSITIVALVVAGASVAAHHHLRKKELLEEFQFVTRSIAGMARLSIAAEDLNAIHSNADATSPGFERVRAFLEQVREINGLQENEIYILRPVSLETFETEFVVMLQNDPFVGDRYVIRPENREAFLEAWKRQPPKSTRIYTDEHGTWISGYAAIRDENNRPVAVVEVDAEISRFLARLRKDLLTSTAIALDAFVIAMIPALLLTRNLTRGLQRLSDGIQRFKSGDPDVKISIASRDEIQRVGEVFNEMVVALQEKLALLPFVSRFTAEAVRRSKEDPSWLTGSEHQVVVLFADLRGFTRYSENRGACVLVGELNKLLGLQAEIVLSAGGDVDKFVGDAVMAVFMDHKDASERAFRCARQMLSRVYPETASSGFQLGLGIGIHCGRAVVGSIGSNSRRDFTAIGHTVNVASRLCDKAQAWQILASEHFVQSLPEKERANFVKTEPLQFKNIQQFVPTYTYRCGVCATTGQLYSFVPPAEDQSKRGIVINAVT